MIIKKYLDMPMTYAPDVGEVVLARRQVTDKYVKGVVLRVWRLRDGALKIKLVWLGSDPDAGHKGNPIIEGEAGYVVAYERPQLIKQISKGRPAGD